MSEEEVNKIIEVYDEVIADLKQEKQQLKDRINKAVEYLNEWEKEPDADMYMFIRDYKEFKHLLDLLKGDKNEKED